MMEAGINHHSYKNPCLYHVVDGLSAGLSRFSSSTGCRSAG